MSAQPKQIRWFRSKPASAGLAASKIDAEAGVIEDVVMAQAGPAKGHDVHLENEFITELAAYGQRVYGERGVKGRFGHPGASDNTMGMQMGFFKNIRTRKGPEGQMQVIGNLHLLESADLSPTHPGMRTYILKMAAESPDFIMSSIVFHEGAIYQRKANNHKTYIGSPEDADPQLGNVYLEFGAAGEWHFTDLVDLGAATDNLFSSQANPHLFVSQAETFFAEHPHLISFLKNNPEKVLAFLTQMGMEVPAPTKTFSMSKVWNFLTGASDEQPAGDATELSALRAEFAAAQTRVTALQTAHDDLQTQLAASTTRETALQAQVTQLQADLAASAARITELEAEPADKHTGADTPPAAPAAPAEANAWEANPINQRALAIRERRQKQAPKK